MNELEANLGWRSHKDWTEQKNPDVVDEIYAVDCVIHSTHLPPELTRGRDAFKQYGTALYTAFPDIRIDHDLVITEEDGEYQAIFWTFSGTHEGDFFGIPATGKKLTMKGADILRAQDNLLTEAWVEQQMWGLMQELGVIPA